MEQNSRILFFLFFCVSLKCCSSSSFPSFSANMSLQLCSHCDQLALIEFKSNFILNIDASNKCPTSYPKTKSWKEDRDCCSWDGVTCDTATGRVIGIDLSCSLLHGSIYSNNSLFQLSHLQKLNLAGNDFNGSKISPEFGLFKSLTHFEGGDNNFNGIIPSSLTNLSKLEVLSLPYNKLVGLVPNFSNESKLVALDLSSNFLNGTIQSVLYNLPSSLHSLDLSDNQFTGPINEFQFQSLEELDLGGNNLNGSIPSSIFNLVNLTWLDLSSSSFSGTLDASMFSQLQNLQGLLLSDNDISFSSNTIVNQTFPNNLQHLYLASCNVTEFPYFVRDLKDLEVLDLSNNRIYGQVPEWFLEVGIDTLYYLNLANNSLTGIKEIPWKSLQLLDLSSNLLQGLLPIPVRMAVYLISNNNLTGELPSLICDSRMRILDLSKNSFSGTIPPCFRNMSQGLEVLNLRNNTFSGKIPDIFDEGCGLLSLNLNDNQLKGPLPRSLVDCKSLELLDLGNNQINDTFPHSLKNLSELRVLVLKSNSFHGSIQDCKDSNCFSKLQIFDISSNEFSGPLPVKYFESLQAMMKTEEGSSDAKYLGEDIYSYHDSVFVVMKGHEYQLVRIIITFKTLDFSNNNFRGEIPDIIGKLTYLKGLNISHNSIGDGIPSSLGNLRNLEWLDLSSNMLTGKIPGKLTGLTFLSQLNLSHNKLIGPIPRSTQFDTFDNSSYKGNSGLCGFPLSKTCDSNGTPPQSQPVLVEENHSESEFDWKIIMMGYSSGLIMGLSLGYIVFCSRKTRMVSQAQRKVA